MLYQITEDTIIAIQNVISATPVVDDDNYFTADDVILKDSIKQLQQIVDDWYHDQALFRGVLPDREE